MLRCYLAFGLALVWPVAVQAKTAQPSNAVILKAIEDLSARVERLEAEQHPLAPVATTTAAPTTAPAAPAKAPDSSVKGWIIHVVPGDDESKASLASFGGPMSEFNFGLHTNYVTGHNEFAYHGAAVFKPDPDDFEPGKAAAYAFEMTLSPIQSRGSGGNYAFNCSGQLKSGDIVIITAKTDYGYNWGLDYGGKMLASRPISFSGSATFDPNKAYDLTFSVNCYADPRNPGQVLENLWPAWQDNRFTIKIKGPNDDTLRAFEPSELYHQVRTKTAR